MGLGLRYERLQLREAVLVLLPLGRPDPVHVCGRDALGEGTALVGAPLAVEIAELPRREVPAVEQSLPDGRLGASGAERIRERVDRVAAGTQRGRVVTDLVTLLV